MMKIPGIGVALRKEILRLQSIRPIPKKNYYHLGLFTNYEGTMSYYVTSKWVGFTKTRPQREIRKARFVIARAAIRVFKSLKEPVVVINTKKDLLFFFQLIGGHAIIEAALAKRYISHLLGPHEYAYSFDGGFEAVDSVSPDKFNRAPSRKLRMTILNRDNRRCKICGSSPAENAHVSLELHHIIPYASGGLTDVTNLITLCNACHSSLEPKVDYSLFHSIGVDMLGKRRKNGTYAKRIEANIKANLSRMAR